MISYDKLEQIAKSLSAYRSDGRENILFDTRDHGNYSEYKWENTVAMLRKADPTGLAMGMLLNEMLEATINGSMVKLSRVLREDGFLAQLSAILEIKRNLDTEIAGPMSAFRAKMEASLSLVSDDFGVPTSLEVAVCLRDAIYSMDTGLSLRWLQCGAVAPASTHIPLNFAVGHYPSLSEFLEMLRTELPLGAHLARIGNDKTAIGIKQPGRIAYLSSFGINVAMGTMQEHRASGYHMAENLDLDTAVERYPKWVTSSTSPGSQPAIPGQNTPEIDHIAKLPRDRLVWLAMVVEMAAQRMAGTAPGDVQLAESLALALPDKAAPAISGFPAVIKPNWQMDVPSLEEMFQSMEFSPWEQKFLRPALDGMTAETFMPRGLGQRIIKLDTREVIDWFPEPSDDYFWKEKIKENTVSLVSISTDWIGDKEEMSAACRQLTGTNLANWLITWGNRRFKAEADSCKAWLVQRLKDNLPKALAAACVQLKPADFRLSNGFHLYGQSAKHKLYNPRCFFDSKSAVTDVALFYPCSSQDLLEMLGLESEDSLPDFMRGWSRSMSWASLPHNGSRTIQPYSTGERWLFTNTGVVNRADSANLAATVCFNRENVQQYLPDPLTDELRRLEKASLCSDTTDYDFPSP